MFWGLFSEQLYLILVLFLLQDLLVKRQCPLVAGMSLFLTENLQERLIVMLCAISYHLCNFKNVKKHPWRSVTFSTKSNTPPWVFFMFFKLHKWYQIAQLIIITMPRSQKLQNEMRLPRQTRVYLQLGIVFKFHFYY